MKPVLFHKQIKKILVLLILFTSVTLFTYVFFFQISDVISLRYIFYSLSFGFLCTLIFQAILLKTGLEQVLMKPIIFFSFLITIFFGILFKIPNNYLLAPKVNIEISIPSEQEGGKPLLIESVQTGFENIWYSRIPLAENILPVENSIMLVPAQSEPSALSLTARAWQSVYFNFIDVQPDMPVTIGLNGNVEKFYVPQDKLGEQVVASVALKKFWVIQLLSDSSILFSVFVILYFFFLLVYFWARKYHLNLDFTKVFLIIFSILVILQFLALNPGRIQLNRDSGVYMYMAKGLLSGLVPYQDIWDHKGPAIFFINFLGLSTGLGRWGVWLIQIIFVTLTLFILYRLLRKNTGVFGVFTGLFVFSTLFFSFIDGGNMVEEYAILPGLASLLLFKDLEENPVSERRLRLIGIGLLTGFTFLLRPNLISTLVCISFYLLVEGLIKKDLKSSLFSLSFLAAGFIGIVALVFLYFIKKAAFLDFFNAVFIYNFVYSSGSGSKSLLKNFFWIFERLPFYMTLTVFGWGFLFVQAVKLRNKIPDLKLVILILFGFLIEIFLYNFSGRHYDHYFLSLLPYVSLVLAYFSSNVFKFIFSHRKLSEWNYPGFISLTILALIFPVNILPKLESINQITPEKIEQEQVLMEVKNYLSEDDSLFIWGGETSINYLLDAPSPNRFVYQYPLMNCDYLISKDISVLIDDLKRESPIIIDSSTTNKDILPLVSEDCSCPLFRPLVEYVDRDYAVAGSLDNGWVVYKQIE